MAEGHQSGRQPDYVSSSKNNYVAVVYVSPNIILLLIMMY